MLVEESRRMNYYHVLGVTDRVSANDLKLAYRKLAVRYHPDKNDGSEYAETRFKEITEAYRVLSNPEHRARYDIMLILEQQEKLANARRQTNERRRNRPPYPPGNPPLKRTAFNSRENIVATAWAIGIFIVIAILSAAAYQYQIHRLQLEEQARLDDAKRRYEQIDALFARGSYQEVLSHLKHLYDKGFYSKKGEAIRFRALNEIEAAGQRAYVAGEYETAANNFQVYIDYQPGYKPEILAKLVHSYQLSKNFKAAIGVYERVIKEEPRTIEARVGLAGIYAENLKDYPNALNHYEVASQLIEKEYIAIYGKAFPLAMDPADAPESHYTLHCGLAKVFISLGKLKQAEAALKWAMFLRPHKPLAYYLMGLRHREARELEDACTAMRKASELGYAKAASYIPLLCKVQAPSSANGNSAINPSRTN